MYGDIIVMSLVINISIKIISLQSVISRYIISASSLAEIFWKRLYKYNTIRYNAVTPTGKHPLWKKITIKEKKKKIQTII